MSRKSIYKLPVIERTLVLESKIPKTQEELEKENERKNKELLEAVSRESFQKGRDDALKKVQNENKLLCQSLKKAIEDLKQERNTVWDQCEKEMIKFTLAVAKKALCHEISNDNGKIIGQVVSEAVSRVKGKKVLSIFMNPDDVEKLKGHNITEFVNVNGDYEIVSDNNISSGGCKVVTDYGSVDASLETRWDEIEKCISMQ